MVVLTKNSDSEWMFAKEAVRRGYSVTPVSPSRRLMFSCGVMSSASEKSTMFVRLAYIRNRRGVSSPLPDIGGGQREGSTPNLKHLIAALCTYRA